MNWKKHVRILNRSARRIPLKDRSIQCVMTSPPYFGLRSYDLPPEIWGGDPGCDHRWGDERVVKLNPDRDSRGGVGVGNTRTQGYAHARGAKISSGAFCRRCGAWRGCLGNEPTPDLYVAHLVEIFREVRRVMRDDGTLWLNLGDSYAAQRSGTHMPAETLGGGTSGRTADGGRVNRGRIDGRNPTRDAAGIGLKHKDLIGIPWRVALALQADGWYLRQDIIWHKPNPMPASVTDRCTTAHEYVFLLTKRPRYHFDSHAIREPAVGCKGGSSFGAQTKAGREQAKAAGAQSRTYDRPDYTTRNRRGVWTIPTRSYKGAHFATFPPALVELCLKAGGRLGAVVLDPFAGSGTVAEVAIKLGQRAVLIDPNPAYCRLAKQRVLKALEV